jgi:hypothetical protein
MTHIAVELYPATFHKACIEIGETNGKCLFPEISGKRTNPKTLSGKEM